jgi:hypothetical protein
MDPLYRAIHHRRMYHRPSMLPDKVLYLYLQLARRNFRWSKPPQLQQTFLVLFRFNNASVTAHTIMISSGNVGHLPSFAIKRTIYVHFFRMVSSVSCYSVVRDFGSVESTRSDR